MSPSAPLIVTLSGALTLAYVNRAALGGGLELALAADLRVAHPSATFSLPEVTVGVTPGMRSVLRLASFIGQGRAREMDLTGRAIDAATALDWGLISAVEENATSAEAAAMEMI